MPEPLKILMAASEVVPYIKTGGLADVIGSLPRALTEEGCDVRVVLPYYSAIERKKFPTRQLKAFSFPFDGAERIAIAHEVRNAAVPTYLIDAPAYFHRTKLYGEADETLRFGFFCRAVLEMLQRIGWQPDIVHCHDWHTGLLPVYLHNKLSDFPALSKLKTIFSIHNLAYQGVCEASYLARLSIDAALFNWHQLEFYGKLNPMKGGLVFADYLTTVSPTYAREIQTPEYGAGLEGVLHERRNRLVGILNGIDYEQWNPARDANLAAHYSADNLNGKAVCKRTLLQRMGLSEPGRRKLPVIGIVSRLSEQKGFDLIEEALEEILNLGCYLVVLGSGQPHYQKFFEAQQHRHPKQVACSLGQFNNELAHNIYAGSDLFLMPSHYEPCGLGQMISLAYGTAPIVRATGGLADTVKEFDPATSGGSGFVFEEYTAAALLLAVQRAIACYKSKSWPRLLRNTFDCDFSWHASAKQYMELYRRTLALSLTSR